MHNVNAVFRAHGLLRILNSHAFKQFNTKIDSITLELEEISNNQDNLQVHQLISLSKFLKQVNEFSTMRERLPRIFLIAIVSEYEIFVGNFLRLIFTEHPKYLNSSEKKFSYKEVADCSDLDAFREKVIEKEIDSIMRESSSNQLKCIENRLNISTLIKFDNYKHFIEISQSRNLFTHCNGIISEQYIQELKNVGLDTTTVKVGDELKCDHKYLLNSRDIILEVAIKLFYTVQSKIFSDDESDELEVRILSISYDLLVEQKNELAIEILTFALNNKITKELIKKMLKINLAISYKRLKKKQKFNEIMNDDWSSSDEDIKLALSVLKENDHEVYRLMKKIGDDKRDRRFSYAHWPLYEDYRKKDDFKNLFREIFNEDLDSSKLEEKSDQAS